MVKTLAARLPLEPLAVVVAVVVGGAMHGDHGLMAVRGLKQAAVVVHTAQDVLP